MIHKEGKRILVIYLVFAVVVHYILYWFFADYWWLFITYNATAIVGLVFLLTFFRNPERRIEKAANNIVYAPCDGKIVAIEEVFDEEYFNAKRIQISIFMSVTNVHVNRNPIGGKVTHYQYHKGKYLVAWHPKSSTENERTTTVIRNDKLEVLIRQIAGAVARRIVNYTKVGQSVQQGEDMGFIKFGSRVDLLLPMDADIQVKIGDTSVGNKTVIATV